MNLNKLIVKKNQSGIAVEELWYVYVLLTIVFKFTVDKLFKS